MADGTWVGSPWGTGSDDLLDLRRIALAADHGARPWVWKGGSTSQTVLRKGDVVLVAQCFENPDRRAVFAEFIATFDPPTVLRLLDCLLMAGSAPGEKDGDG